MDLQYKGAFGAVAFAALGLFLTKIPVSAAQNRLGGETICKKKNWIHFDIFKLALLKKAMITNTQGLNKVN